MAQPKKLSNNTESHLGTFGIHATGFERYESPTFLIEGQRDSDYRWKLTNKKTGQTVQCMTLSAALEEIKGPDPEPQESGTGEATDTAQARSDKTEKGV